MVDKTKIVHTPAITLKRSSKGYYSWEIRCSKDNLIEVIEDIKKANEKLIKEFEES